MLNRYIHIGIVSLCVVAAARGQSFVNWETPHVNPIALTPDGSRLLVVNTADNRLEVFDVTSGTPVAVQSIPVGLDPVSVRARSNGEVWVVNHISDSVSIIDLPSGRVIRTLLTADEPADVVFAGTPQRAFITQSQLNQVAVYDPNNLAAAPSIVAIQGEDPRAMAVDATGANVYVAIFESANKTTIVDQPNVSNPAGPYGGQNPPPNSGNTFDPPRTPGQPPAPPVSQIVRKNAAGQWMDDNNRNWSAFVTWDLHDQDVAIINTSTLAVTYARGLMTTVMNLAVAPSGEVTAIGTEALNQMRFEPNVSGIFIRAQLSSFSAAAPVTVSIADLNPHLDYSTNNIPAGTRDESVGDPRAIVWHPSGDRAYVAGMGSNNVIAIDSTGARLGRIDVGQGPTGLALSATGNYLYVLNKFDGSVTTIDASTDTVVDTVSFFDPTPSVIKLGRPILYDSHMTSGLGQVACASCHIDGRTDHLAWDLGDPSGDVKVVNQDCRQGPGNCSPWHPMKGPMVTQSLQGIIGTEPLHWRGDREDLPAFAVAFTELQGADEQPTPTQLQEFTDFIETIKYPPNPNRNLDGTLRNNVPTSNGTGNAAAGLNIFSTAPTLPGLPCIGCHALPSGTDMTIDDPPVGPPEQSLKIAQLRNMNEKAGMNRGSLTNNRGFGFNHDSDKDTLFNLLGPPFNFPPGPPGQQQRRDVEAFLLSLSTDTHASVGQQVTFDGTNNNNAQLITRLTTFTTAANSNQIGLVAKGRQGGIDRGYSYIGGNNLQSDRDDETIDITTLRTSAAAGNEITFMAVPVGSQTRIGIDRDEDGYFDRDELDGCSDPANAASIPPQCAPDDTDGDGVVDGADNCPLLSNANQLDADEDGVGDICDICPSDNPNDSDGDGICTSADNCPGNPNASQADSDSDGVGDVCDTCPLDNPNDVDDDGICGANDNCPTVANAGQDDTNGNEVGDACECPAAVACIDGDACTFDQCGGQVCQHAAGRFGDVNGSGGIVTIDDILCGLSGFTNYALCPNADISPCSQNGTINLDDLLAVLAAFGGADQCGCGG